MAKLASSGRLPRLCVLGVPNNPFLPSDKEFLVLVSATTPENDGTSNYPK